MCQTTNFVIALDCLYSRWAFLLTWPFAGGLGCSWMLKVSMRQRMLIALCLGTDLSKSDSGSFRRSSTALC